MGIIRRNVKTMKRFITRISLPLLLTLGLAGCDGKSDPDLTALALSGVGATSDPTSCATNITAANNTYQLACTPSAGAVRHIRVEGVLTQAASGHGAVYISSGYTDGIAGTTTSPSLAANDGRFILTLYQGGPVAYARYGTETAYATDNGNPPSALGGDGTSTFSSFATSASTVCYDISGDSVPKVTVWATGVNSADCTDWNTLNSGNAIISKANWTSNVGIGSTSSTSHYFKASSASGVSATKVVLFSTSVL